MTAVEEPVTQDDRGAITVPRPHVAHGPQGVHPDQADADYLRAAVRNIEYQDRGERLWGSGVTAMIVRLLTDAAAALEAPARPSVPTVTAEQVRAHTPASVGSIMSEAYTGQYVTCSCQANRWGDGPRIPVAEYPDHVLAAVGIEVQP